MREFNPHLILRECCPLPLGEEYRTNSGDKPCYVRAMPFAYCCWGRNFYFQPVLLEFNFQDFAERHGSKETFFSPRWNADDRPKKITDLDGIERQIPQLIFYLFVNRGVFPPRQAHHNEVEWLNSITQRTRGIAHELLYADQYAKYFDPEIGRPNRPIELPDVEEEEKLLCPCHQIEDTLHYIEKKYAIKYQNEGDFRNYQSTEAVQQYYSLWLKQFGVEREVCHRRTCAYLDSGKRNYHKKMTDALLKCMKKQEFDKIDPLFFISQVDRQTGFYNDFMGELNGEGCPFSPPEIIEHTLILIKRRSL
jgi:hypothetical protein